MSTSIRIYAKNLTEAKLSQTAENILALAGLTLVGFCVVVTRAFSLPVRYQLAFVLETQLERVQTKIFAWITFSRFFTLEHNGVDFSLKLAWMKKYDSPA
ncbi:hypothetical protein Gpo141_00011997 [Globisporangium polare]